MRGALVSYFDVGTSFGIGDEAFTRAQIAPSPDIGLIGISNPLGQGLTFEVDDENADLIGQWRG